MTSSPTGAEPQPAGGPRVTRFVTRGGHRLSYESHGAADGVPVLALHDLLADRRQFQPLAEMLRADGFRVMLADARGHGASAMISGRGYSAHETAADALAILDGEGVQAAHVVAFGWGSVTALAMALAAPVRTRSLVLAQPLLPGIRAAAAGNAREAARRNELLREAGIAADRGLTERALDLYLGMRCGEGWRDTLPKPQLAAMRRALGSLGPLLAGLATDALDRDALAHLNVPVTLLLRRDATDGERATVAALASLLPPAGLETVPVAPVLAAAPEAWMDAFAAVLRAAAPSDHS